MLHAGVRPNMPRAALRPLAPVDLPPLRAVRLLNPLPNPLPGRLRMLHDSRRTGQAYLYGAWAFIRFHGLRHPADMGAPRSKHA
jgi:hypothetical protein